MPLRAIGYQADQPYIRLRESCWNFQCYKAGVEVEFLDMTLRVMNTSGTIVQLDADIEQSIDMVANGSADITLMSAIQSLDRMKLVDFTTPIGFVYYGYLLREIPEIAVADYIMNIFDPDTLLILLGFGILVGSLIFLYTCLFNLRFRSLVDWIIVSCSGLINQYTFKIHSPICALIIVAFWLWSCQIIVTYYQAKLKSFLLLSHHRGTIFTTLDGVLDAVEHRDWTIVLQERGYTPYLWCTPKQCARLDRLSNKILRISADANIVDYLAMGKHVGFTGIASDLASSQISYFDFPHKILFVRDKLMAPEYLAFAVTKKHHRLREQFNRAVALTMGGYETVRLRYVSSFAEYNSATSQSQTAYVLKNLHFLQLYHFLFLAYAVSAFAFIIEILFHRITRQGFDWRNFPRPHTIILPIRRSYSPEHSKRYTVG